MQLQRLGLTGIAVMSGLLIQGCSDPDASASRQTATEFWQASTENQTENLQQLLLQDDPSSRFWIAGVRTGDRFDIGTGNLDEQTGLWEVPTALHQPCRNDIAFNTLVRIEDDTARIDGTGTLRNLMLAWQAPPTEVKTYCYPVADQPLTGEISGRPWQATQFQSQTVPGSQGENALRFISGQWCEPSDAANCNQPSEVRLILKLDLEGAEQGRNLSGNDRLIVQKEGEPDRVLREGSYRLDRAATPRLGIRAKNDEMNLDGYVALPRAALEKWSGRN